MTDKIIKQMINNFDVEMLDLYELKKYNEYRAKGLPKFISILKLVYHHKDLSEGLQEIKDFIMEYEITLNIDE